MGRLSLTYCAVATLFSPALLFAQTPPAPAATPATFTLDYPMDRPGVLIQGSSWEDLRNEMPAKTRTAHGFAASLSYGAVPAKVVADYAGEHASTEVSPGPVIICICHFASIPGEPVIVRLHPKKDARELDGGRMIVYPVVGGTKMADANKSDLLAVRTEHPESGVWLVRSQVPLPPGEYALMLGTQNISIFPFTIASPSLDPAGHQ